MAEVTDSSETHGVGEPDLPRPHKMPKRYEDGNALCEIHNKLKAYYEAIDLAINSIKDRFQQPGYAVYCQLENLLLKAAYKHKEFKREFDFVCSFYKDDFQPELLHTQLGIFNTEFQHFNKSSSAPTIIDLIEYFLPSQMLKKVYSLKWSL